MYFIMADCRVPAESHEEAQKLLSTGIKFKREFLKRPRPVLVQNCLTDIDGIDAIINSLKGQTFEGGFSVQRQIEHRSMCQLVRTLEDSKNELRLEFHNWQQSLAIFNFPLQFFNFPY